MSGVSDKLRACPLWPGLAPPGRDPSRFALRSVDGGFEDVRDVLSGRCSRSTNSTNSGFVSPSSSLRFMDRMNHNRPALARGWVVTSMRCHIIFDLMQNQDLCLLEYDSVCYFVSVLDYLIRLLCRYF